MSASFRDLGEARFRANTAYELLVYDQLPLAEREALASLTDSAEFYGVLRPLREGLNVKSVSGEAALLWFSLRTPGPMPRYFRSLLANRFSETLARLVLDEILEVEHDGHFVSGTAAHAALCGEVKTEVNQGAIASLSLRALRYAEQLDLNDSATLTSRIYCYNRLPITPRWRRELPSEDAVASFLGLSSRGLPRGRARWERTEPRFGHEGWLRFHRGLNNEIAPRPRFKLYVSPRCERMREALRVMAAVLGQQRSARFKTGRDLIGLLRPDKMVAYFDTLDEVKEVADQVLSKLAGIPAHGVPFTSEIGGNGLLSWGMDPPRETQVLGWQAQTSWRLWLIGKLAVALCATRRALAPVPPWQFALDRISLEGIDPQTWTPRQSLWLGEA